jgi:two-component system, cell cycle sensor histidine kinase and response regulator CckA
MLSAAPVASRPARILIVEDEGLIAHNIASELVAAGYEVSGIADSCKDTLAQVHESHPDLILMDIRIKGALDGIETAMAVRDRFDIPVIYLTAHSDPQTINRAKMTGASGFLTKPIRRMAIGIAVEMALHKNQADRELRNKNAWMETVLSYLLCERAW